MTLLTIGINHQTAPVELRERVAFADHALPGALAALRTLDGVREVVLLSTCNRTELYASVNGDARVLDAWMASHPADDPSMRQDLGAYLYRHEGQAAVRHLFRVATGLDSLVLGEPQILGQVKQAWAAARTAGTLGGELDRLFQRAFVTAKRARTDTRIGANPVSVASTAVRLAQESFARPGHSVALLVGAGETIELVARHLAQSGVKQLLVANRTLAHAQELASRYGGVALPLEELQRHLADADIVFSATASREPVITRSHVEGALAARRRRPMLLMDLAVPRDIDPAVGGLPDAFLYTIDDLERAVEHNRASRREAADAAEAIVELHVARYAEQHAASSRVAPVRRLRTHGERARDEVLAKARHQLATGHDPARVLEFLANTLTNRLLHAPTVALRQAALEDDHALARASEKLFPFEHGAAGPETDDDPSGTLPPDAT